MNAERDYSRYKFYFKSKLYNVMAAYALQRRLPNMGITVSTLHPGSVNTSIVQGFNDKTLLKFLMNSIRWTLRSPKDGAATTINCAVNPELNSQQCIYYDSCRPTTSSAASRNESYQEELWRRSIDMVKDFLSASTLATYGPGESQSSPPPHTGAEVRLGW
jgi:hypothetical protein